uniref:Uncharacterized protein n=1 Tax=Anguilla anguilla TaxID=7936 RepID=A0A0E9PZ81_ANGAN
MMPKLSLYTIKRVMSCPITF